MFIKGWMFFHTRKGWPEPRIGRASVHLGWDSMTGDKKKKNKTKNKKKTKQNKKNQKPTKKPNHLYLLLGRSLKEFDEKDMFRSCDLV